MSNNIMYRVPMDGLSDSFTSANLPIFVSDDLEAMYRQPEVKDFILTLKREFNKKDSSFSLEFPLDKNKVILCATSDAYNKYSIDKLGDIIVSAYKEALKDTIWQMNDKYKDIQPEPPIQLKNREDIFNLKNIDLMGKGYLSNAPVAVFGSEQFYAVIDSSMPEEKPYISQVINSNEKTKETHSDNKKDYYNIYTQEEETAFMKLLKKVVNERISDSLNDFHISHNAGKYEMDVFYKDNYLFRVEDASSYNKGNVLNVVPATQDTEKIMQMLPLIDYLHVMNSDIQFDYEKYGIKKVTHSASTNLVCNDEDIVVMMNRDNVFIGKSSNYDNAGHYNNSTDSLIQISTKDNKDKIRFFKYLHASGITVSLEEMDKENIFGGIKGLSECLIVEESLKEYGIIRKEGHPFTVEGKPFDREVLDNYIKEKHPEIKAYQEHFNKICPKDFSMDDVPSIDTKIAKTMAKEHYSKERVASAIELGSPFAHVSENPKGYVQGVLAGKFKSAESYR